MVSPLRRIARGSGSIRDRENWVGRIVSGAKTWLNNTGAPSYDEGLRLAETAANILEAKQLVALRELPTRKVALLHPAPPDFPGTAGVPRGPREQARTVSAQPVDQRGSVQRGSVGA